MDDTAHVRDAVERVSPASAQPATKECDDKHPAHIGEEFQRPYVREVLPKDNAAYNDKKHGEAFRKGEQPAEPAKTRSLPLGDAAELFHESTYPSKGVV